LTCSPYIQGGRWLMADVHWQAAIRKLADL
jgi:hypothetical protein